MSSSLPATHSSPSPLSAGLLVQSDKEGHVQTPRQLPAAFSEITCPPWHLAIAVQIAYCIAKTMLPSTTTMWRLAEILSLDSARHCRHTSCGWVRASCTVWSSSLWFTASGTAIEYTHTLYRQPCPLSPLTDIASKFQGSKVICALCDDCYSPSHINMPSLDFGPSSSSCQSVYQ